MVTSKVHLSGPSQATRLGMNQVTQSEETEIFFELVSFYLSHSLFPPVHTQDSGALFDFNQPAWRDRLAAGGAGYGGQLSPAGVCIRVEERLT